MSSNMWQQGAQSLTLILLLAVICARATPMPTAMPQEQEQKQELTTTEMVLEMDPESEPEPEPESRRIDCKLTFDATMGSLEQQQLLQANGCNVPHTSSTNKPTDVEQRQEQDEEKLSTSVLRHSMSGGSSQPLYELQLVVWPAGIEDVAVTTTPRTTTKATTTTTTTTPTPTTTQSPSVLPLYEDQLVVFPQMDFEEEHFDYFFDELETAATSTTTSRPRPTTASQPAVYVLENYRKRHPNGTEEHKLVLSNGLVNYMKHYAKRVDNKLINVQEGYSSVPIAGLTPQIQTLHYIADERGYNIYKIERSPLPSTELPNRVLHKSTKAPASKPHV